MISLQQFFFLQVIEVDMLKRLLYTRWLMVKGPILSPTVRWYTFGTNLCIFPCKPYLKVQLLQVSLRLRGGHNKTEMGGVTRRPAKYWNCVPDCSSSALRYSADYGTAGPHPQGARERFDILETEIICANSTASGDWVGWNSLFCRGGAH